MKATGAAIVIVALKAEARTLRRRRDLHILVSGPGPDAAQRTVTTALRASPSAIISWGVAGALHPDLRPGTVLWPQRVVTEDGRTFLAAAQRGSATCLVSVSAPVCTPEERQALAERFDASSVDMESATIAAACHAAGVPFLCVRAIADASDLRLPVWIAAAMGADGRAALTPVLRNLLRRPQDLPALLRAGLGFRRALAGLERSATELRV